MTPPFAPTEHNEPLVLSARDVERAEPPVPWTDHLEELRCRLWWCVTSVFAATCVAFAWSKPLVAWLAQPVGRLVFVEVQEALVVHLKVALAAGCLAASPVIAYHVWEFVSVGLQSRERRLARQLIPWSAALFIGGAVFGYALMIPQLMRVFLSFSSPTLQPMISVNSYLSFIVWIVLAFGLAFELPLVMWGLSRLGVVSRTFWRHARPVAIVAIFVLAAIVTPGPDVVSQCLVAIPLVVLYEISAWLSSFDGVR